MAYGKPSLCLIQPSPSVPLRLYAVSFPWSISFPLCFSLTLALVSFPACYYLSPRFARPNDLSPGSRQHIFKTVQVLHFSDRGGVFRQAHTLLRPGGHFFAADFVQEAQLTADEWTVRK